MHALVVPIINFITYPSVTLCPQEPSGPAVAGRVPHRQPSIADDSSSSSEESCDVKDGPGPERDKRRLGRQV